MEVLRALEVCSIKELKILSNVRLINKRDLNQVSSVDNLHVQFSLSGELKGNITCYLCLDGQSMSAIDKNYIFPLFVEAMNILVGRQMSLDQELKNFKALLSPPKLSMIPQEVNSALKSSMQYYMLELDGYSFPILTTYSIEALS